MSFLETFGGWWKLKDVPTQEEFAKQIQVIEKLNLPAELGHKMHAAVREGTLVPKTEFKGKNLSPYNQFT